MTVYSWKCLDNIELFLCVQICAKIMVPHIRTSISQPIELKTSMLSGVTQSILLSPVERLFKQWCSEQVLVKSRYGMHPYKNRFAKEGSVSTTELLQLKIHTL